MNKLLVFICLTAIVSVSQAAQKRYVSDQLWLQLRSGPSTEFRILKALASGEHLVFLEENLEAGYTKVKTGKGLEGWVLTRFLVDEPVAKEKLVYANRERKSLKAELATTKDKFKKLDAEVTDLRSRRSTLSRTQEMLQKELDRIKEISENALALDRKVKKLTQHNQELEIQVDALSAENAQFQSDKRERFIIYGGALVLIGIIAGLVLPNVRSSKRGGSEWA